MPTVGRRRRFVAAGLFALALSAFAQDTARAADLPSEGVYADRIDWGVVMDLSGPTSASQSLYVYGVQDYARMVNEAGGINGRKLNILSEDDRFDPGQDRIAFEKLSNQTPVLGISGFGNSGGQVVLNSRIRSGSVPVLGAYAIAGPLMTPSTPMYWASFCGLKEMAQVGVGTLAERLKLTAPKVVTVHFDTSGGTEYAGYVRNAVAKMGGTSEALPIKPTAADATPQVLEIIKAKPDFIAVHGSATTVTLLLRAMDQYGIDLPVFGIAYLGEPSVYGSVPPKLGSHYLFPSCFTPGDSASTVPGVKQMAEAGTRYGHAGIISDINYVGGWVDGQIVTEAIRALGSDISRARLVALLNSGFKVDTRGVSSPVSYASGDHRGFTELKLFGFDYDANRFQSFGEYDDSKRFVGP